MKNIKDLLQQFDDIQDLPVSEEILGAYMEGRLENSELEGVAKIVESDNHLSEIIQDASEDNTVELGNISHPWDIYEGDFGFWELGLPPVLSPKDITSDVEEGNNEELSNDYDRFKGEDTLYPHNAENSLSDNPLNSNVMAKPTSKTFGYESNRNKDTYDPNIDQGPQPSCAIRSQEIVLRDYGIAIPQEELIQYAIQKGWYDPDPVNGGTPRQCVGNILEACGIPTQRTENATIYDIISELRAGHRVIVSVDANELWIKNEPSLVNRLFGEFENKVQDAFDALNGIQGANHALIVAGVTVNPKDPSDIRVTLIDSGRGDACIEYKLSDFEEALADSNHYMVSTTIPAPYQYNFETREMEPSSFYTDYIPSMSSLPMGIHNEFVLDESYYDKYSEYTPEYHAISPIQEDSECENDETDNASSVYGNNENDISNNNEEDFQFSSTNGGNGDDYNEDLTEDQNNPFEGVGETNEDDVNEDSEAYNDIEGESLSED